MQPRRRQILQGAASYLAGGLALSSDCLAATEPRVPSGHRPTPTERAQPIELQQRGTFDGVIDFYFENSQVDLAQAKRLGVRGVIYRTSLGLYDRLQERQAYHAAKAKARDLGLLWGAFHVPSHEDVDHQLTNFSQLRTGRIKRP